MGTTAEPYYRHDLASVHHQGFGFHAEICGPGLLELLEPVRRRGGLVLELGCGSGRLTRKLVDAGHRVIATDASPAMLELARDFAGDAATIRRLTLPDDPLPDADAVVAIGHPINYLPDEEALDRALVAVAHAVRPGGLFAIDVCDLTWAAARRDLTDSGRVGDDWAIITRFSTPTPARFVRDITTFIRTDDGHWRRDDERHVNVLIDTSKVPALLTPHGVEVVVRSSFGTEQLPEGLHVLVGRKPAS
jgi:SAM-dependent methyltransferase